MQPEKQPETKPLVLSNARLVLADRVIETGWIVIVDRMIADLGADRAPAGAEDVAGDFIIPGLIELHTDHLEAHYMPRPKVYWDPVAAVVSYDGQLAACGITTVLDSLRVWREEGVDEVGGEASVLAAAIPQAQCHVAGACNPATGACTNPNATNGTGCNDSNACTTEMPTLPPMLRSRLKIGVPSLRRRMSASRCASRGIAASAWPPPRTSRCVFNEKTRLAAYVASMTIESSTLMVMIDGARSGAVSLRVSA